MPFVPVDINQIQLDQKPDYNNPAVRNAAILDLYGDQAPAEAQQVQPQAGGYAPVDINQIKLDAPAQPQQEQSIGRTALDQGLQGATFGFGDEITNALGALGAGAYMKAFRPELMEGQSGSDLMDQATGMSKERLKEEFQQNPGTSIAANIAGALLTGGAGAATKAGSAIANSLRTGNLAARVAKGAATGATSGGLYGAGTADEGDRLQGAEQGAISGAVVGGALPGIGAAASSISQGAQNAAKGVLARSPEALQDAASTLKSGAGDLYNQMRQVGATFKPSAVQGFLLPDIDTAISKNNFIPALNPKTLAIVDDLKQKSANGTLGLDELDQYRRLLGRIGSSEDGVSAGAARKAIDNFVANTNGSSLISGSKDAVDLLKQGRSQYAQASKFEDVADILKRAAGDPNKIKSGLTSFLNKDSNTKGWATAEKQALKQAASTGTVEKLLKMGGKFGIDLGTSLTPGNTIGPIVGGMVNPIVPVAGTIARQGQKYLARGKAENLLNLIQNGKGQAAQSSPVSPLISLLGANTSGAAVGQQQSPARIGLTKIPARNP